MLVLRWARTENLERLARSLGVPLPAGGDGSPLLRGAYQRRLVRAVAMALEAMIHKNRGYRIQDFPSLGELAAALHGRTHALCAGFRAGKLTLLNDSFSENGAQEYTVLHADRPGKQIESITVSWVESPERLLKSLRECEANPDQGVSLAFGGFAPHPEGGCPLCA